MAVGSREELLKYHKKLQVYFGPQKWWPGETRFEVMVGAILAQHTGWANVEKAIRNLKTFRLLDPRKIHELDEATLQEAIRPAGHFRKKAARLKALVRWLVERYQGELEKAMRRPAAAVREELLEIKGIGPETADSILLYALDMPTFVVDTYTYRVLSRHQLVPEETSYDEMQQFFHENLPRDAKLFNEFHALFVEVGKKFCKTQAKCEECPLKIFLPQYR